ncbi:glycosyl hydrolase family protein [Thalassotalea litorea]|uniref:Glycosyl hydrolase family protein n=1 Tax=Thalassotalea litorea TaxID=2020715 RepID=A0A5R9IFM7_9GAMM|nr:family 16 glycosylhydrolase [Thalassotalea litorea]TLU64330.1 glycosyl hydrolase family protein [Thalassotalea litorea]
MNLLKNSLFITSLLICSSVIAAPVMPLSEQNSQKNWVLNQDVSDEFNGAKLDTFKWYVQGTDQQFYLWKGRAPSQFAPHNVRLENGMLKLRTQWQPDYPFVGAPPARQEIDKFENITTAAVISHHTFLYGYMEVRVKIPDAAMTGAFWGTGYQQELDVFELIGRVKTGSRKPEKRFVTSIHDWRPGHPKKNKVWKHGHDLPERTAERFYTYGVEWLPDGLKMYLDGELVHHATQKEMGDTWLLNNPLELWFDSEVFPWHGIPEEHELPVDFEIDYVRVWQQPNDNLLQPAFFGFEGPYLSEVVYKPESRNGYQKFWWIDDKSSNYLNITEHDDFVFNTGRKSLKFAHQKPFTENEVVAFAADGSIDLSPGNYQLTMKVLKKNASGLKAITAILEDPWQVLKPIDISKVEVNQWTQVETQFVQQKTSSGKDRLRIVIRKEDVQGDASEVYIDDINIIKL